MSSKKSPGGSKKNPNSSPSKEKEPVPAKEEDQEDDDCLYVPKNSPIIDLTQPQGSGEPSSGAFNRVPVIVNGSRPTSKASHSLSPPKRKNPYSRESTDMAPPPRCRVMGNMSPPDRPSTSSGIEASGNFHFNRSPTSPQNNPELVHLLTRDSKSPPYPNNIISRPAKAAKPPTPATSSAPSPSSSNGAVAKAKSLPNVEVIPMTSPPQSQSHPSRSRRSILSIILNGFFLKPPAEEENTICTLCWESALDKDPVLSLCLHTFCSRCYLLANRARGQCPKCRALIPHEYFEYPPQPQP